MGASVIGVPFMVEFCPVFIEVGVMVLKPWSETVFACLDWPQSGRTTVEGKKEIPSPRFYLRTALLVLVMCRVLP